MKIILVLIVIFLVTPVYAATYYVDATTGDDSDDGLSEANAWQTTNKLQVEMGNFNAGDNIYFKRGEVWDYDTNGFAANTDVDLWVTTLNWQDSGTNGSPITIGAYGTGAKPIISGLWTLDTANDWTDTGSNIWSIDYQTNPNSEESYKTLRNIWIDGTPQFRASNSGSVDSTNTWYADENNFTLYVYSTSNPATNYTSGGVQIPQPRVVIHMDDVDYVTIENLDIRGGHHTIEYDKTCTDNIVDTCDIYWWGKYGIIAGDMVAADVFDNFTIQDCNLYGNKSYVRNTGEGDGIFLTPDVSGALITRNYVEDHVHAGINVRWNSVSTKPTNNTITYNEITAPNSQYARGLDIVCDSTTVAYNYVHDTNITNQMGGDDLKIYNNLIVDVTLSPKRESGGQSSGLTLSNPIHTAPPHMRLTNSEIYNNTIARVYEHKIVVFGGGSSNTFKNNVMTQEAGDEDDYGVFYFSSTINDDVWEFNYFDTTESANVVRDESTDRTLAATEALYSNWQNNIAGDISLPEDVIPQIGSPVIDVGTDVSDTLTDDFIGTSRPQGDGWDIGGYEYIPSGGGPDPEQPLSGSYAFRGIRMGCGLTIK